MSVLYEPHGRFKPADSLFQPCTVEGLEHIVAYAAAHCGTYDRIIVCGGYHNDLHVNIDLSQLCKELYAVHPGHKIVEHHELSSRGVLGKICERVAAASEFPAKLEL